LGWNVKAAKYSFQMERAGALGSVAEVVE